MGDYLGSRVTRIFDSSEMIWPFWDEDDTEEERHAKEEFYDQYSGLKNIKVTDILTFAQTRNIPVEELQVETYIPDDREGYGHCILLWKREVPEEEYQQMLDAYTNNLAVSQQQYQQELVQWEQAKEQYKIDKAAYELHKAQEKLNSLRGS